MKITFYYSKSTGKITSYCKSEVGQDMSFFGEHEADMSIIADYVVFDYTTEYEQVINNRENFVIDLNTKEITPPVNTREEIQKLKEENKELKTQQQAQSSFIDATMMATDEIYTMLEPLLGITQTMSVLNDEVKEVNKMVEFYAAMVIRGLKDVNDVPLRYREDVKKLLSELEK